MDSCTDSCSIKIMVHQSALQSTRHVIPADFAAGVRKQILGGDSVEAANFLAILLMMTWALFVPKGKHQQSTGCLACNLASRERGYNFTVWLSPPYIARQPSMRVSGTTLLKLVCKESGGCWRSCVCLHTGSPDEKGRTQRATGVLAVAGPADAPVRIRFAAPVVVCACNALNTPCLLLRSGIHGNKQVGAHLQCHPIAFAVGTFPQVGSHQSSCFPAHQACLDLSTASPCSSLCSGVSVSRRHLDCFSCSLLLH